MESDEEEGHDGEEAGALDLLPYKLCMLYVRTVTSCSGAAMPVASARRVSALERQHSTLARNLEGLSQPQQDDYSDDQGQQWSTVQHVLLLIKLATNAKQLLRRAQAFQPAHALLT